MPFAVAYPCVVWLIYVSHAHAHAHAHRCRLRPHALAASPAQFGKLPPNSQSRTWILLCSPRSLEWVRGNVSGIFLLHFSPNLGAVATNERVTRHEHKLTRYHECDVDSASVRCDVDGSGTQACGHVKGKILSPTHGQQQQQNGKKKNQRGCDPKPCRKAIPFVSVHTCKSNY